MKRFLPVTILIYTFITGCKKDNAITETVSQNQELTTTQANQNLIENTRNVPLDALFYNDCCQEAVYVVGTAHLVTTDNIQHVEVNNITGTGLSSGLSYLSLSPSVLTNVFYSNPNVGIFTFILNMKNDNGCSFRIKATFQLHVNAGGSTTIEFENYDTFCY